VDWVGALSVVDAGGYVQVTLNPATVGPSGPAGGASSSAAISGLAGGSVPTGFTPRGAVSIAEEAGNFLAVGFGTGVGAASKYSADQLGTIAITPGVFAAGGLLVQFDNTAVAYGPGGPPITVGRMFVIGG